MERIEKSLENLEFFYISFPFPRFSPDKSNFSTRFDEVMRVCLTVVFFNSTAVSWREGARVTGGG